MTIELENVVKNYDGNRVLDGISFDIEEEHTYVLTGPSGCGKTTLLRILLGLEKPDSGRVRLLGDYKYEYVAAGCVFQEHRLCEGFSAVENVSMISKYQDKISARQELLKLLPKDCLDKPVSELSGGMKRRVEIVRACFAVSDMLVLDEPFTGLDAESREKALAYIRQKAGKKSIIITAHEMTEDLKTVDKAISNSRIIEIPIEKS